MSKAGKGDGVDAGAVGSQHPVPENIPHLSSPINGGGAGAASAIPKHLGFGGANAPAGSAAAGLQAAANAVPQGMQAGSPVKESSFLNRETSASETEEQETKPAQQENAPAAAAAEPLAAGGAGIPIRR